MAPALTHVVGWRDDARAQPQVTHHNVYILHIHQPNHVQLRALELTDDRRLYALTQALEQQYAEAFSFGFVGLAHKELYAQTGSDFHVFRVGLRFGGAVVLLAWVLWNALADSSEGVNLFRHPIINVYAAVGGVLLLGWTWALNLAVWERAGVDYRSILHFKTPMTSVEAVFAEVSTASTVYLANLLLYYKLLRGVAGPFQAVPSLLLPILLVAYFMYKAFFPWEQRREIWEILAQIVIAPFGKVEFVHLYFADTMTSFNKGACVGAGVGWWCIGRVGRGVQDLVCPCIIDLQSHIHTYAQQPVSYETVMGMCYMVQQEYIDDHRGGISGAHATQHPSTCDAYHFPLPYPSRHQPHTHVPPKQNRTSTQAPQSPQSHRPVGPTPSRRSTSRPS